MARVSELPEAEGEGYFASVSDLMVGVLFVFLLMLTILALNFRDDSAQFDELKREAARQAKAAQELRVLNEEMKHRLAEAATALQRELRDREAARAGLLQRLATRLQDGGIKFTLDQQSGVLRLSDSVPFATGRSDLTDETRKTLLVLGHVLGDVLPCFAAAPDRHECQADDSPILETVLVEGHTDSQPYPRMTALQSEQENDRLSAARALTVFTELRQREPSLDTLRNPSGQPLLGISGYGQRRPLPASTGSADTELTRNRRIDIRFVLASRTSDELKALLSSIDRLQHADVP
jgi:flagellar motor protein MotB